MPVVPPCGSVAGSPGAGKDSRLQANLDTRAGERATEAARKDRATLEKLHAVARLTSPEFLVCVRLRHKLQLLEIRGEPSRCADRIGIAGSRPHERFHSLELSSSQAVTVLAARNQILGRVENAMVGCQHQRPLALPD